jgi:hypothetical protein
VAVNSGAIDGWRRTIEGIYPNLRRRSDIDVALFDEMLGVLAEYRSQAPGAASGK